MAARLNLAPDAKHEIIQDAMSRIMAGDTLELIAHDHHISERTLNHYLADIGEEYTELRKAWIDGKLIEAEQKLANIPDPTSREDVPQAQFRLARARAYIDLATFYATSRDSRYRKDQPTQASDTLNTVSAALLLRVASLLPTQPITHTIEHDASAIKHIDHTANVSE